MEQVDYSTIERLRFNGTDINNFFVNGVLIWVKHSSGVYYKGQIVYFRSGPVTLSVLATDLNFIGVNAIGDVIYFNLQNDRENLALIEPPNTSGFHIGQIIFVDGKEARITGIDGKVLYYVYLDGTTESTDSSVATNITTVGTGTGGGGDGTGGVDTSLYQVGETIYYNGELATIRGIGTGTLFLELQDGTFETVGTGSGLSDEANTTGFDIGDTIYINGREAIVTGVAGGIVTYQFVDDGSYGSLDTGNTGGQLGTAPNTSGYNVGDIIYVNGRQAVVTGVNGTVITYKFLDNGLTGTSNTGTSDNNSLSTDPNTTGYNIGDIFYLNGVRCVVTDIKGGTLFYRTDNGVTGSLDPSTATGISNTAPNLTTFLVGQVCFIDGVRKTIIAIAGTTLTLDDNSTVDINVDNVTKHLHWDDAPKYYNNYNSTWNNPQ